jgi:hypothetical protein
MEFILNSLNIRTGSLGKDRKNIVANLFKRIIDVMFPNFVKYLFWACSNSKGLFEDTTAEDIEKRKKMSKY